MKSPVDDALGARSASILLQALDGHVPARTPVWMMRQAGRYLPEYRELRAKAGDFLSLCYTPDYATEVTLQPIRRFGFDAAILFSDILVVPHALGMKLAFETGEGPRLDPVGNLGELHALRGTLDPARTGPVFEAVAKIRAGLPRETALLGFCGAPWTVATYMIAGRGTPDQAPARLASLTDPAFFDALIDRLVEVSADYLVGQLEAGADAVLVVAPYYSRPSQEGVFCHYKAVNDSADKPIIIYDVPGRTGLHIQLETYCRLADLDHVKAVKDATGDIAGAVRKRMETGLTWYSGDDGLFLPFLSVGAVGIISVIAHAAAGPMRDLANAFDRGDIHEAQRISVQLAPLVEAMNGNGFQAVMAKASLKVRGILDSTEMRLPNVGPGEAELVHAEKGMRAAGLL